MDKQVMLPLLLIAAIGACDMGSNASPDGWEVTKGVWGANVDRTESVTRNGGTAVHFPATAAQEAEIWSDWMPIQSEFSTVPYGGRFNLWTIVKADANTGADTWFVRLNYYNASRTPIGSHTIGSGPVAAVNTWEYYGQATAAFNGARWARFQINRSASAFNLYVDSVWLQGAPPFIEGTQIQFGGQSVGSSTAWTQLILDSSTFTYTSNEVLVSSANRVQLNVPGLYSINGYVKVEDPGSGAGTAERNMEAAVNRVGTRYVMYPFVKYLPPGGSTWYCVSHFNYMTFIHGGIYWLELSYRQNTGSTVQVVEAFLDVVRVGR